MKRTIKILLPILIIAIGALGAWVMIAFKDKPERQIPETQAPLVRVSTAFLK